METINTYTPERYNKLIDIVKSILRAEYDEDYARVLIHEHGLYEKYDACLITDCEYCTEEGGSCTRWADWITQHGEVK